MYKLKYSSIICLIVIFFVIFSGCNKKQEDDCYLSEPISNVLATVDNYVIYEHDVDMISTYLSFIMNENRINIEASDISESQKQVLLEELDSFAFDDDFILDKLIDDKKCVIVAEKLGLAAKDEEVDAYMQEITRSEAELTKAELDSSSQIVQKFQDIMQINQSEFDEWQRTQIYETITIAKLYSAMPETQVIEHLDKIVVN